MYPIEDAKLLQIRILTVYGSESNRLATSNKTIFQDGCSYACTLLLVIFYVRCFVFRNVAMATAATQYCNICDHDNESNLSATWCPECEDFLCTDCNRNHARSSSTKQHIVISLENYQKLPSSIISIKNRCTKHGNKYELYCSIHGDPCCVMCIRDDHRHCQELRPIREITENAKSSTALCT